MSFSLRDPPSVSVSVSLRFYWHAGLFSLRLAQQAHIEADDISCLSKPALFGHLRSNVSFIQPRSCACMCVLYVCFGCLRMQAEANFSRLVLERLVTSNDPNRRGQRTEQICFREDACDVQLGDRGHDPVPPLASMRGAQFRMRWRSIDHLSRKISEDGSSVPLLN